MFSAKKPLSVNVTHTIELPDIQEAVEPVIDNLKQLLRTVGITLAIGIPSVIVFGVLASVAGEALTAQLINNAEPQ